MSTREAADAVADAVLATPGVAGLHPGMFGEVGTYLPGRRVDGVRLGDTDIDVHVTVQEGAPVRETAAAVREAVARQFPGRAVNVTVEDVIAAG
ncbi:hypothetical protein FK535_05725 [Mycolicibacterium sp. 018/SC-01/001]|uniref:hypothetical protein n=1 Tax=Mycolicibacterium sp. 018/SC-01/001 TaxID=2592069 RepID=UPI00117E2940|nr:hypothetical protein [Mycolicibacterium sp. 018/SC-01/001]TRW87932.1 hypothetical protein FK535_05725 [Mycolicibacterium sp. 018/SC-01/001]